MLRRRQGQGLLPTSWDPEPRRSDSSSSTTRVWTKLCLHFSNSSPGAFVVRAFLVHAGREPQMAYTDNDNTGYLHHYSGAPTDRQSGAASHALPFDGGQVSTSRLPQSFATSGGHAVQPQGPDRSSARVVTSHKGRIQEGFTGDEKSFPPWIPPGTCVPEPATEWTSL